MYVRKFEADTLEEALKEIKRELGPDAIILKTTSNKGLKGALKKRKIEITAAISEKSYVKKAKVDHVLNDDQKDKFYNNQSSLISNMIDNYQSNNSTVKNDSSAPKSGYGALGLNRSVQSAKEQNASKPASTDFDKFLSVENKKEFNTPASNAEKRNAQPSQINNLNTSQQQDNETSVVTHVDESNSEKRFYQIERKIGELTRELEKIRPTAPDAVLNLRQTLLSLNINSTFVTSLIRKMQFQMTESDLSNEDAVFEFAMREMLETVKVKLPIFSSSDVGQTVTVLISDNPCGQASFLRKMVGMREGAKLISLREKTSSDSFTDKILNIQVEHVESYPKMLTAVKNSREEGKDIFIDLKTCGSNEADIKKYLDGLKRSFDNVEILVCLSAIHSETYNQSVIKKYASFSAGVVINFLDQCLEYGSIFNIANQFPQMPFLFFGTGRMVPDDVESATAERIISGIFKLN
jgi:flagellar biosynthesis protein FlhF